MDKPTGYIVVAPALSRNKKAAWGVEWACVIEEPRAIDLNGAVIRHLTDQLFGLA